MHANLNSFFFFFFGDCVCILSFVLLLQSHSLSICLTLFRRLSLTRPLSISLYLFPSLSHPLSLPLSLSLSRLSSLISRLSVLFSFLLSHHLFFSFLVLSSSPPIRKCPSVSSRQSPYFPYPSFIHQPINGSWLSVYSMTQEGTHDFHAPSKSSGWSHAAWEGEGKVRGGGGNLYNFQGGNPF